MLLMLKDTNFVWYFRDFFFRNNYSFFIKTACFANWTGSNIVDSQLFNVIFRLFLTLYPRLKNEFDFNSQFFRRSFRYCVILCLLGYLFNFNKSIVQVSIRIMRGQHVINFLNCTEGQTNEIKKIGLVTRKSTRLSYLWKYQF